MARTICRRAERTIIGLTRYSTGIPTNPRIQIYLNRLSDLLFVWSRLCNDNGEKDVLWEPGKKQERP
jgi:cob(I)alamin adenosyltransferase